MILHKGNITTIRTSLLFTASFLFLLLQLIMSTLADHQTSTISQQNGNVALVSDAETKTRAHDAFTHERIGLDDQYELLPSLTLYKRASMRGFQGMRGKKNGYEPTLDDDSLYVDRKVPMEFQGLGGGNTQLDVLAYLYDVLNKRAPYSAFQGVRGKKSLEELAEIMEKRARMAGFQGMRGKKAEEYDYVAERAPSRGFQDIRRKRSIIATNESINSSLDNFHKSFPFIPSTRNTEIMYEPDDASNSKRDRSRFIGLRGKRSADYYEGTEVNRFEKRSPYWFLNSRGKKNPRWESRAKGFVGVRGKRQRTTRDLPWPNFVLLTNIIRNKTMTLEPEVVGNNVGNHSRFIGLRDKRSADYYDGTEVNRFEKRSPYWFLNSRGKKNPRWESRAKGFVGVRGKRQRTPRQLPWSVNIFDELKLAADNLRLPEQH